MDGFVELDQWYTRFTTDEHRSMLAGHVLNHTEPVRKWLYDAHHIVGKTDYHMHKESLCEALVKHLSCYNECTGPAKADNCSSVRQEIEGMYNRVGMLLYDEPVASKVPPLVTSPQFAPLTLNANKRPALSADDVSGKEASCEKRARMGAVDMDAVAMDAVAIDWAYIFQDGVLYMVERGNPTSPVWNTVTDACNYMIAGDVVGHVEEGRVVLTNSAETTTSVPHVIDQAYVDDFAELHLSTRNQSDIVQMIKVVSNVLGVEFATPTKVAPEPEVVTAETWALRLYNLHMRSWPQDMLAYLLPKLYKLGADNIMPMVSGAVMGHGDQQTRRFRLGVKLQLGAELLHTCYELPPMPSANSKSCAAQVDRLIHQLEITEWPELLQHLIGERLSLDFAREYVADQKMRTWHPRQIQLVAEYMLTIVGNATSLPLEEGDMVSEPDADMESEMDLETAVTASSVRKVKADKRTKSLPAKARPAMPQQQQQPEKVINP